jgi:hypothetical protein
VHDPSRPLHILSHRSHHERNLCSSLDTGQRVQGFLNTEAAAIGPVVPAPLRAQLDAAVTQLASAHLARVATGARGRSVTTNRLARRDDTFTIDIVRTFLSSRAA